MSEVAPVALQPGAAFLGRYQIVRAIKAGGMGALYEVIHLETRRRRALKVMLPDVVADPDLRARFRLEATITADIDSEHIVETFDAGIDPETNAPFLVMELLKGDDLSGHIARRGRIPAAEVVTLLHQLAIALDKTHAAAIVHRDLKPENLFITARDDGSPRLKVLDFGIAKIVAQSTQSAQVNATRNMGTPLYMAPEQLGADGRLGPRADLYAVGHIAYTMLVGFSYWEDDPAIEGGVWPLLVKVMAGAEEAASVRAARRGATLPPSFDVWFTQATALSPEARFPSARAMITTLADALAVPAPAPASTASPPPEGPALSVSGTHVMMPVIAGTGPSALASSLGGGTSAPHVVMRAGATFAPTTSVSPVPPRRSALPWVAGGLLLLLAGLGGTMALVAAGRHPAASAPSVLSEAPGRAPSAAAPAGPDPTVTVVAGPTAPSPADPAPPSSATAKPLAVSSATTRWPSRPPTPPVTQPALPVDPTRSR